MRGGNLSQTALSIERMSSSDTSMFRSTLRFPWLVVNIFLECGSHSAVSPCVSPTRSWLTCAKGKRRQRYRRHSPRASRQMICKSHTLGKYFGIQANSFHTSFPPTIMSPLSRDVGDRIIGYHCHFECHNHYRDPGSTTCRKRLPPLTNALSFSLTVLKSVRTTTGRSSSSTTASA